MMAEKKLLLKLLKTRPYFLDELLNKFRLKNRSSMRNIYKELVIEDYPLRMFKFTRRSQTSNTRFKTDSVVFTIFFFEGFELDAIELILTTYPSLIGNLSWVNMISPIMGESITPPNTVYGNFDNIVSIMNYLTERRDMGVLAR